MAVQSSQGDEYMGGQGFEANVAITGSSLYETLDMAKLVWGEAVERLSSTSECIIWEGETS